MAEILIVEDEQIVARDLQVSLTRMGYGVSGVAASADEALRAADASRPDLVLMDIRIKGAQDGIDTAELLRKQHGVPVVYLTAHADDATLARAARTEPFGFVLKPFNPKELRSTVDIALYKHGLEVQLRTRERWLSTTLRAIGDAVVAVDAGGRVRLLNPAAEALLGAREEEARGRTFSEIAPLSDASTGERLADPVDAALRERHVTRIVGSAMLGDRHVEDSAAPIITDDGEVLGAVVVIHDSTEERRLQSQVALADRMRSLGTLASGVAHEINNPLAFVVVNVDILRNELDRIGRTLGSLAPRTVSDSIARGHESLDDIRVGADRIRRIVSDLSVFGRPVEEPQQPIDVREVVRWALRMTANQLRPRARVTTELDEVPLVEASSTGLVQVVVNLLVNAAQAIPEGHPADQMVTVRTGRSPDGRVLLSVSDTGSGIAPEHLERIFEPFFSTKVPDAQQGMGLGLAICHGIVRGLGGEIAVQSTPGAGTTVEVLLPPAPGAAPPPAQIASPSTGTARGRVLVVDDEELMLKVIECCLQPEHDVVVTPDARVALDLLAAGEEFDLVLCDVMMAPMSGADLYDAVRERKPELLERIVFISGGAFTQKMATFLATVPNRVLAKPFLLDDLRAQVAELVARRRSS